MPVDGTFSDDLDIHNFVEDDFDDSNPFDFSNSPNMLQSLETMSTGGQKAFISPQELSKPGSFIESPNDSYQDSSSDSSSKRAGSSSSSPPKAQAPNGDVTMEDGKDMWNRDLDAFDDDIFSFGRDAQDTNGLYGFGELEGEFMDHTFDFESPVTSPEGQAAAAQAAAPLSLTTSAPDMNTIKARKPKAKKAKPSTHQKRPSVCFPMTLALYHHADQVLASVCWSKRFQYYRFARGVPNVDDAGKHPRDISSIIRHLASSQCWPEFRPKCEW